MDKGLNFGQFTGKGHTVRYKLITTFIIIALVPVCLLTWFSFQHVNNTLRHNANNELNELSNIGKQFANIWFSDHVNDLYLLKSQLDSNPAKKQYLTNEFVKHYDFVNYVEFIDTSSFDIAPNSYFSQSLQRDFITIYTEEGNTSQPLFRTIVVNGKGHHIIALPIVNTQNQLQKILLADVNLQGLVNNLSKIHAASSNIAFYLMHNKKVEKQATTTTLDNQFFSSK
ncbi:hypothetical protein P20652_3299 [Pseudoalteromonas sp. BSi20652]|uniref:hypothetical protein n=1 Tax=Pseudoalteromonas sp. BSi20652 TaxID=388384 RepID=UPI000231ABBB|nr:hypothetical protein [Pseudoalteromonas sp. BSi20652]GAA61422.1 hypothetical protein P20652_3299 [Pseudoalteromonas sp. BSi20652]